MSWSVSVPAGPHRDIEERARAAVAAADVGVAMNAQAPAEAQAQAEAALAVILELSSVVAATETTYVAASLSGHANPQQQPPEGLPRDTISITVYQTAPSV